MNRREAEQLIQSSFDGELPPLVEEDLATLLRESEEARDAWCDYALLTTELRRHASQSLSRPGSIPPSTAYAAARQRRRQVVGSLAAAAAVLALGAWILTTVFVRPGNPPVSCSISGGSILLRDGSPFGEGPLEAGQGLELRQGVVRLEFANGVLGIIEGPARLKVDSDLNLELPEGRAHFHVPAGARGFTVEGPGMRVVDLGTEFGVDFRDSDQVSAAVFKGHVRVEATGGRKEMLELTAGDSVSLTPVGSFRAAGSTGTYFKSLPDDLPEFRLNFDREDKNGRIPGEGNLSGEGGFSARIVAKDPQAYGFVDGVFGHALELRGDAELVSDWPGIHGNAPRTVSLMFRLAPDGDYRSAPPLAIWGLAGGSMNHKFKLAVVTERDGRNYTRVSFGAWYANGSIRIADDRWHHLAAVWDGELEGGRPRVRVYLDGQPDAFSFESVTDSTDFGTDTLDPTALPLSLGRYELPSPPGSPHFRGCIDELRVIAGALTSEQVRELDERQR